MTENYLTGNIIYGKFNSVDSNALLSDMSDFLFDKNIVTSSFKKSILDREAEFPTGLPTVGIGVAIPHTEHNHAIKQSVFIAGLENPITFSMMTDPDEKVEVGVVFMLVIDKEGDHIELLQRVIELCQDEKTLKILKEGKDKTLIMEIMNRLNR